MRAERVGNVIRGNVMNVNITPPRIGPQPWEVVRSKLDQSLPFANMREPTLIYSMGGTHAEAVRRQVDVVVKDVRHSRNGRYADIMVERLRELKLDKGRIGLMEIDPRHNDYMPVNQYNVLKHNLPDAELVFTKGFLHDLLVIHSEEELACVRIAGKLCQDAMEAMVARARPGVKEYELRAAAGAAILEGGGDIDFL